MNAKLSFELNQDDVTVSDPEGLADRLAAFLRSNLRPDDADRDLIVMLVDRLFLGMCDDFDDEELLRGPEVQFSALTQDQIDSMKAMKSAAEKTTTKAKAAKAAR